MNYTNFSSRKSFAWKFFLRFPCWNCRKGLRSLETQPKISFILSLLRLIAKVQVNVFACSAAISACAKTSNWRQAMSLLEKANEVQVELNVGISLALGSGEPTLSSISCFGFYFVSVTNIYICGVFNLLDAFLRTCLKRFVCQFFGKLVPCLFVVSGVKSVLDAFFTPWAPGRC